MTNYLFPVQTGETGELLPHIAADKPTEFTVGDLTDDPEDGRTEIPDNVLDVLERLYPDQDIAKKCSNLLELTDALDPGRGILVHEYYSQPHTVIGYHESLSEDEARAVISEIEERLGYELDGKEDIEPLSEEEITNKLPKTAGWTRDGEFRA